MGEIAEALKRAREAAPEAQPTTVPLPAAPRPARPSGLAPSAVALDGTSSELWQPRTVLVEPQGPAASQFRHLALRLSRVIESRGIRSLLITSSSESEGKTTVSCNLAIALASLRGEDRVALVDFDVRRPAAAAALGVQPGASLADAIEGRARLADCGLRAEGLPLDLYLTKTAHPDPVRLISSPGTREVLGDLRRGYALTIIDTPPVLPVPDVPLLQPHVDGMLLVVRAGAARRAAFKETLATLERDDITGIVLNQSGTAVPGYYYSYHGGDEAEAGDV